MSDLVHKVEALFHLPLLQTASGNLFQNMSDVRENCNLAMQSLLIVHYTTHNNSKAKQFNLKNSKKKKDHKMSHVMRKLAFWFPTWSDTNKAVLLQKMAGFLKFRA